MEMHGWAWRFQRIMYSIRIMKEVSYGRNYGMSSEIYANVMIRQNSIQLVGHTSIFSINMIDGCGVSTAGRTIGWYNKQQRHTSYGWGGLPQSSCRPSWLISLWFMQLFPNGNSMMESLTYLQRWYLISSKLNTDAKRTVGVINSRHAIIPSLCARKW